MNTLPKPRDLARHAVTAFAWLLLGLCSIGLQTTGANAQTSRAANIMTAGLEWSKVQYQVNAIMDNAIESYEIPGLLLAIKTPGKEPYLAARGVASIETGEKLESDHRFRIGSASKTFTGMAALKLINEGRLNFESTLDTLVDDDVLSNYPKSEITVRMLLRHTSGINTYTDVIDDWFIPYIYDRTRVWTNEELVELINVAFDAPCEGPADPCTGQLFTPGAGWYYSNTNTVLLGMVVENITGMELGEYIHQEFIEPLGLVDTYYPKPGEYEIQGKHTQGYMNWANFTGADFLPSDLMNVTDYDPSGVGPAGPMISTVRDLSVWVEAVARNESLVGDLLRGHIDWRYYTAFSSTAPGEASGSYGMNIAHEPDYNNDSNYWIVGHRGQISGFDTAMMYLPAEGVAFVVVANRSLAIEPGWPDNAATAAMNDIIGYLLPDVVAAGKTAGSGTGLNESRKSASKRQSGNGRFRNFPLSEYR